MARPIKHWHKYRYDESLNKWVRKKRYKHPVITVVKLDPEQCLLTTCATAALYWEANPSQVCITPGAVNGFCSIRVRGRMRGSGRRVTSVQPS